MQMIFRAIRTGRSPVAVLLLAPAVIAWQQAPLRVSVTLVQVDAVVTGRDGRHVEDLTRNDFELFEDGRKREITHFSYVRLGEAADPARAAYGGAPPRREQVRRTLAIVVDDLRMSWDSVHRTRETLDRFIDRQMAPGDVVAIISTSGGLGAFSRFTTDRQALHAAVNRLRFRLDGVGQTDSVETLGAGGEGVPDGVKQRRFALGVLAAVRYIAEGMRDLPGRKSLVLFSDGLSMSKLPKKAEGLATQEMRRASDGANRAAVVIHAIDPRGLFVIRPQAKDDVGQLDPTELYEAAAERGVKHLDQQVGLDFLAYETGGTAIANFNDFNAGLERALADQDGYYLLGFQPGEGDSQRISREGKYHRLTVRVKRPGLHVRYRKGYMGETPDPREAPMSNAERLLAALDSPFAPAGLALRLTPDVEHTAKDRTALRVLLHIAGQSLEFGPPDAEGFRTAKLMMLLATEGEGRDSVGRSQTVRVKAEALERLARGGFVYTLEQPIKRPGPYQVRVAVLDELSGRTGMASRFLEIPDFSKGGLAISPVMMGDGDWRSGAARPEADLSPAIRVFGFDRPFSWGVTVFNARFDPSTGQPSVQLQPRLMQGDKVVWQGKRVPVALAAGMDPARIPAGGVLTLGDRTPAGEYVLEVEAVDPAAKARRIVQWTTFELR
ncbi:MAG: VWA domain-containing protein [Acidobacteria bacterium]|nr:VWA domain-containing protein [Acidobacteriota bacterium]